MSCLPNGLIGAKSAEDWCAEAQAVSGLSFSPRKIRAVARELGHYSRVGRSVLMNEHQFRLVAGIISRSPAQETQDQVESGDLASDSGAGA